MSQRLAATFVRTALAATMATLAPSTAQAGVILAIDDLTTAGIDVIIADNAPAGTATTLGPTTAPDIMLGPFEAVAFVSGLSSLALPEYGLFVDGHTDSLGRLTLQISSYFAPEKGELLFMLTDTDFVAQGETWLRGRYNSCCSDVTLDGWLDAGNLEFGTGTVTGSVAFPGAGSSFGDQTNALAGALAAPFSLTEQVRVLNMGSAGSAFSLTFILNATDEAPAVPEPSAMLLLGTGLAGLGFVRTTRVTSRRFTVHRL